MKKTKLEKKVKEKKVNNKKDVDSRIKSRKRNKKIKILVLVLLLIIIITTVIAIVINLNKRRDERIASEKEEALQVVNTQFTVYEGEQSYNGIKSLMTAVMSNNSRNKEHQITVYFNDELKTPREISSSVNSKITYIVGLVYDEAGYTSKILITEKK